MEKPILDIVKIGGNVLDDPAALEPFLRSFSDLKSEKILVHGGGKLASALADRLQIPQLMIDGRRVTDAPTLDLAVMVYAGLISKSLVAALQSRGCNAIGLCGADADLIKSRKRVSAAVDYGFVGDIDSTGINTERIIQMLQMGLCPVFSAITHDGHAQLLNTNADTIASALSVALMTQYKVRLSLCFEEAGVWANADSKMIVPELDKTGFEDMKKRGVVSKGMIPKLDAALHAASFGMQVRICSYSDIDGGNKACGGTIVKP